MKYLDPKNDLIFKKVFGEHPDILRSFLNSMLPLAEGQEIVELEYLSPEMIPETFLEKFTAVDVRCRDNHGRQFLVEMQMNWTTAFKQRVLFNASKAYVTQSDKGVEFKSLKPVYALNLINENYLPQSPDYYHHYAIVHHKDSNERLYGLEFVFIELEKFKAQNIRDKKLQVLWLRFLTEVGEKTEQIDPELLEQPEINKAIQYVMEASLTKEEKLRYEKNWDRISSEKTLLTAAKEEGRDEGRDEGRKEGRKEGIVEGIEKGREAERIELVRNAKKMGMSTDQICKLTGLSREEVEQGS